MKEPPLPCETTMSGKFSPSSGQSITPGKVILPRRTSPGGSAQGHHNAPRRAGPPASAGISMNRKPAACATVAARQRAIATRNLFAHIGRSPDKKDSFVFIDVSSVLHSIAYLQRAYGTCLICPEPET